jgi:hypothetical protein
MIITPTTIAGPTTCILTITDAADGNQKTDRQTQRPVRKIGPFLFVVA